MIFDQACESLAGKLSSVITVEDFLGVATMDRFFVIDRTNLHGQRNLPDEAKAFNQGLQWLDGVNPMGR